MPARRHANGAGEIPPRPAPSSEEAVTLATTIAGLADLDADRLRLQWRNHLGGTPPAHLPRWLLMKVLAYRLQAAALGDIDKATVRVIRRPKGGGGDDAAPLPFAPRDPATREGVGLKAGGFAGSGVERQAGAGDGARQGLRLERQDLWQPLADRQGDDRDELERPSLLWAANGRLPRWTNNQASRTRGRRSRIGHKTGRL